MSSPYHQRQVPETDLKSAGTASSEGEDDDWEEHHEWTYTELDDDDDDESGERKLANSGYHHYAGGLMGTAEGVTTSRNEGRRIAFNKGKSREALTANQQSDSKSSQQRKESAYATNNKSTKLFKSRAPNSTVNSTKAKFVRAGGGQFRGQALHICDRLEDYARTNPDNLYWGFPTVSVRTMPVAVRVPEASTDAITPVLPIAYESAEAFTQRVFTEPLALYPDAAVNYHETHTDFLEPVVFLANHVDRDVEYVDEDVVAPVYAEDMAVPVMEGHEAPVLEDAAETTAETAANDDMPTVIEMKDSVEYVPPVSENVHTDFIAAPDVAVDANAPAEDVYDGADEKTDNIAYDAVLGVDDADPGYYQEVAEPVVHVTVQTLSFPAPAI
ncbi:hypothetical protein HPB52_016836 [Rhipicephalus sanguineus]|uniref:Uncharacterized protein n=1 Tax=Rhipicephalus sanguineus TaxID=34632 RepID=A0A9D4T7Y7_RHISA|nr:hypothetical protein HPB52_016836 [Rhipicephalus sanguineus]